ncbi:MAG: tRNA pseudouridine(55) synthase TruB [Pseudomonadota bacterium]
MARKKKGIPIHGWINLSKPVGVTSTQAVGKIRRATKAQKVGHGGTLDPLASGILPIALGEATKTVNFIQDATKEYEFEVTWGEQRTTDDSEGDVLHSSDKTPSKEAIEAILDEFVGEIEQTPPQFSAIKIDGERAYDIARDGDHADIKSRMVTIHSLEIIDHEEKTIFITSCGKGTYIRALARDMGQKLGCFGYISALKRIKVGDFSLENAISLDFFQEMIDNPSQKENMDYGLLPIQAVLGDIPALAVKEEEMVRIKNGNPLTFLSKDDLGRLEVANIDWKSDESTTALALYNDHALAMIDVYGGKIQPVRVFNI